MILLFLYVHVREQTISEWKTVFWFLFSIYIGTALFYAIFASTDLQPWDSENDEADENNHEKN
ncbi:hypothetical protein Avbf_16205 [Armadillidium vulgare]|nr:hypothetical protein Avbf_16205 [Armadillidium vulgare]